MAAVLATTFSLSAYASNFSRVDADVRAYDERAAAMEGQFNLMPPAPERRDWVQAKLNHMVDLDQWVRNTMMNVPFERNYNDQEKIEFNTQLRPLWLAVDATNTADLKRLLKIYSWFKISEFGAAADHAAFLLVQHADADPAFQDQVLRILETLWPSGETRAANYAYLFDRVATSWGDPSHRKPQRYGTQGACTGPGTWAPWATEDPQNLDVRRRQMGLEPEADYINRFKDICHEDQRPKV